MILSTRGRYAVMAMVELASREEKRPVTLADISEAQEIPLAYLEQIFAKLRKAGLVKSVRGPGGGYQLGQPASQTWVSEIILAAEEAIKMTRCETGSAGCMAPRTRCLTHDLWEGLGNQIYSYLRSVSLEDICERRLHQKAAGILPMQNAMPFAAGEALER